MSRVARSVIAAVAVFAFSTVPLAADWCAITCEAAHSARAAAPACHHTASAGLHIGQAPKPCGQDHHVIVLTAATNPPDASWSSVPAFVPTRILHTAAVPATSLIRHATHAFEPPHETIPLALSSALRI